MIRRGWWRRAAQRLVWRAPRAVAWRSPCGGRKRSARDDGQILLLALGYTLIAFTLVAVAVDATAVHLARTQLLDAADAAALDAADAVDPAGVYTGGLARDVPLTDAAVRDQATSYLSSYRAPSRLNGIGLTGGTGSPDGATAVVELTGTVRLPVAAPVVAAFAGGITVTVRSTARAELRP
jgi:putative Flp pilus-assembly TadE/G-like protein